MMTRKEPYDQLSNVRGGWRNSPAKIRVFALFKLTVSAVFLLFLGFWILLHYTTDMFRHSSRCKGSWPMHDYVVLTPGCRILDMAPHETNLLSYFNLGAVPGPLVCQGSARGELVKSTTTHLYLDMKVARNYTKKDFHCCYRPFSRLTASYNATEEYDMFIDYMNLYLDYCIPILFKDYTLISFKFVHVVCKEAVAEEQSINETNAVIYEDYFTFAVDSETQNRAFKAFSKSRGTQSGDTEPDNSKEDTEGVDMEEHSDNSLPGNHYSVLILGFDGMSRLNFIRQMPRTMAFFEENGGTTLLGFNKVGYNTFPNLVPILTGMNTAELKQECWPNNRTVFDNCPFIWKKFKENGYITAYGEDNTFVSTFSYQKTGFRTAPVDYYLKPFFVETEINLRVTKLEPHTSILCVGNKPNMVRFENAVRSFVSNMKDRPSFGLFWLNGVSHDYLNLPRIGDTVFRGMLDKLKEDGALKSTVLIGLSDHGIRWGDFRQTFQGFLEERLPLATIVLPESFKAKYPRDVEYLSLNARRLSTPFDIYKTLLDILYRKYQTTPNNVTHKSNKTYLNTPFGHGISLFSKIPVNRTCYSAGIPTEWCACSELQVIPTNVTFAKRLGTIAVKSLNRHLRDATQCEFLTLDKVMAVWEDIPATLDVQRKYLFSDYVVNFLTSPGRGRFEARLRVRGSIDERMKPKSIIKLIGVISRLNMYKQDSYCVSSPLLKLYCYCSSGNRKKNTVTESPSEFHDVVNSSLAFPIWPIPQNNIERRFSVADLPALPEDSSKRSKLKKILKRRTRYEIVKMRGRNRTGKHFGSTLPLFERIERSRRDKLAPMQARDQAPTSTSVVTTVSSMSTFMTRHKQELIYITDGFNEPFMQDNEKLYVTAAESIMGSPTNRDEGEKFQLDGLDTNYRP